MGDVGASSPRPSSSPPKQRSRWCCQPACFTSCSSAHGRREATTVSRCKGGQPPKTPVSCSCCNHEAVEHWQQGVGQP